MGKVAGFMGVGSQFREMPKLPEMKEVMLHGSVGVFVTAYKRCRW